MIKSFLLQEIKSIFGGELLVNNLPENNSDLFINSISTDTRAISAGDLFVALRGDNYDAHDYLQEAVDKGAKALVINESSRHQLNSLS
jgi:UDP-N-acetylmuramoyl-tripeptide--D-alanyl-D-alanine ligase